MAAESSPTQFYGSDYDIHVLADPEFVNTPLNSIDSRKIFSIDVDVTLWNNNPEKKTTVKMGVIILINLASKCGTRKELYTQPLKNVIMCIIDRIKNSYSLSPKLTKEGIIHTDTICSLNGDTKVVGKLDGNIVIHHKTGKVIYIDNEGNTHIEAPRNMSGGGGNANANANNNKYSLFNIKKYSLFKETNNNNNNKENNINNTFYYNKRNMELNKDDHMGSGLEIDWVSLIKNVNLNMKENLFALCFGDNAANGFFNVTIDGQIEQYPLIFFCQAIQKMMRLTVDEITGRSKDLTKRDIIVDKKLKIDHNTDLSMISITKFKKYMRNRERRELFKNELLLIANRAAFHQAKAMGVYNNLGGGSGKKTKKVKKVGSRVRRCGAKLSNKKNASRCKKVMATGSRAKRCHLHKGK